MVAWVDCTGRSDIFAGWAADLGVWTGPWPFLYPTRLAGLTDTDQVALIVALPNTGFPGDPVHAVDGSYPTKWWRATNAPSEFGATGWDMGAVLLGESDLPQLGEHPPAGCHLWVVVTRAAGMPGDAPEGYAPVGYTAVTTGPKDVEGWSDWQASVVVGPERIPRVAEAIGGAYWPRFNAWLDHDPPDSGNQTTVIEPGVNVVTSVAGSAYVAEYERALWGLDIEAEGSLYTVIVQQVYGLPPPFGPGDYTSALVQVLQSAVEFAAPPLPPPPVSSDFELGTSYKPPPFHGTQWWQYENPFGLNLLWGSVTVHLIGYEGDFPFQTEGNAVHEPFGRFQVWGFDDYPAGPPSAALDSHPDPGGGLFALFDQRCGASDVSTDDRYTFDLGTAGFGERFTLVAGEQGTFVATFDPNTAPPLISDVGQYEWGMTFNWYGVEGEPVQTQLTRDSGRWRIWLGPVLRTIGANFDTPADVQLWGKPAGTWIPVQRHA